MHTDVGGRPFQSTSERREVDEITSILRGEMSAVEAYRQVLDSVRNDPRASELNGILSDHSYAVSFWDRQLRNHEMVAELSSGPWGTVVEAFVGTAKFFGNRAALKALKEGEEHGLKQYEAFCDDDEIAPQQRRYVGEVLIPNQRRHITIIDRMMEVQ